MSTTCHLIQCVCQQWGRLTLLDDSRLLSSLGTCGQVCVSEVKPIGITGGSHRAIAELYKTACVVNGFDE